MSATIAWDVYVPVPPRVYPRRKTAGEKLLTTVYFTPACSPDDVRRSLIHHDGFRSDIRVKRRN
jgi:hypothetical protein